MKTGLLNLSDDTLQYIGSLIHGDTDIPLPSFHPHTLNFATEIDPVVHKDYMSFRATCKRLFEHNNDAPQSVREGIRRLHIDIFRSSTGNDSLVVWQTFSTFLMSLKSLEEIVIKQSHLCAFRHAHSDFIGRHPDFRFKHQVQAMAFEMNCSKCAKSLPKSLASGSKPLRTLKLAHLQGVNQDETLIKELSNRDVYFSHCLRTLYVKIDGDTDGIASLEKIAEDLPYLQTLALSSFSHVHDLLGLFHLFAHTNSLSDLSWAFKLCCDESYDHLMDPESIQSFPVDPRWSSFLETFAKFKHLRSLDLTINVIICNKPLSDAHQNRNLKRSTVEAQNLARRGQPSRNDFLLSAMKAAAVLMVKHVPTLESDYLWSHHFDRVYSEHDDRSYRYFWKRESSEDGNWDITISDTMECFHDDAMINEDGSA
ncbi:hypothetical protein I203_103377 [Kwoniella mangroviensis CBS 8507]|uniref:uncharacterized protein n=1 Tax=Kwoniella mangroviensis CBS 8507 TaxID=1296122 RepID=UPI00080D720D|nr:uncharacterized protein I203_06084 [Kwoniella mangroviensis CBS 8507]OCF64840.1 hypothetical protein I203_06084 [Kwoniella mangroviensis CBS 8507]